VAFAKAIVMIESVGVVAPSARKIAATALQLVAGFKLKLPWDGPAFKMAIASVAARDVSTFRCSNE
jgi:hypothetical protein